MKRNPRPQYWSESVTGASWEKLVALCGEVDVVVVGGWAVYLWTQAQKSKDIDVLVDYGVLTQLRDRYRVERNERLHKYEVKLEGFDLDIYLPHYSKLAIPVEDLLREHVTKVQGIATVTPEALLALKQAAELDRRGSSKGTKDVLDILNLLLDAPLDLQKYKVLLDRHRLGHLIPELITILTDFDTRDLRYLGLNLKDFAHWRRALLVQLRAL